MKLVTTRLSGIYKFALSSLYAVVLLLLLALPCIANAGQKIQVGLMNVTDPGENSIFIDKTVEYLKNLPALDIDIVKVVGVSEVTSRIVQNLDFLIAPPLCITKQEQNFGLHRIAAKKKLSGETQYDGVASAIFVLAESPYQSLADLKSKTVVASSKNRLGSWVALEGELEKKGFDHNSFFKEAIFLDYPIPDAFSALLSKKVDAAVLSACKFEALVSQGYIRKEDFRLINGKSSDHLLCLHSTDLYPDLIVTATPRADPSISKKVAVALLNMSPVDGYEWGIPSACLEINALLKILKEGPFFYLTTQGLKAFLFEYWPIAFSIFLLIVGLFINEWRLKKQVKEKTEKLREVDLQKQKALETARESREKLHKLQQTGVVAQLSNIVAHELKQPIGTILNYIQLLRLRLNDVLNEDEKSGDAILAIDSAANRMNFIVERVRAYAKKDEMENEYCSLSNIVDSAVNVYFKDNPKVDFIKWTPPAFDTTVYGCKLELELMVLNLLKNAMKAASEDISTPEVKISIEKRNKSFVIKVQNTGGILRDKDLERIKEGMSINSTTEGIGLGLPIIRGIVSKHGGQIKFEKPQNNRGLLVSILLDA